MDSGTQKQRAQAQIGQWQYDIEILAHVPMMQEVMAVQAEENSRAFHGAFSRQVHAPMHVFVSAVIGATGHKRAGGKSPILQKNRNHHERNDPDRDQSRSVPPGHGNRPFVLLVNEMIGFVRPENMMMHEGVAFEWIDEEFHAPMHDETVQCPFEERRENGGDQKAYRGPEEESGYQGSEWVKGLGLLINISAAGR